MISERTLYVGIVPIGQREPVPAGILKLVRRDMIESGSFAYGRRYLTTPEMISLNPEHLPLRQEPFELPEQRLRDGGALPLTLCDALPDAWGRWVLEAKYGRKLDDTEVLLLTNADRVGALVFSETLPIPAEEPTADLFELDALADAAHRLEYHMEIPKALQRLLQQGGSLGGARPKASFIHEGRRHIAKFPARDDEVDVQVLEAGSLGLARTCGIRVPQYFLQPIRRGNALVLRRFDREGPIADELRFHFLSASALLDVPYESSAGSYVEFAQVLRRISFAPTLDVVELFRRMVFNMAIDNTDDHIKNHGVLHVGHGHYRLSPAFDLVPQRHNLGRQELAILPGRYDAHLDLAREAAPHFGLGPAEAAKIIDEIIQTVRDQWYVTMQAHGANDEMLHVLRRHFDAQFALIGATT
ncbi:HipA domain-containing protein [Niveibacterium sp. 24ML]|uniref:type II toxin-antitoxin system HipA family toxin n=1 Tax=Niveibacterium sp. 24ML TaxID=2985512 RepID=UPI002271DE55|nr:HipA domain-containing protein [Niveibacterium sp. 24ML]MCX9154992.1 HipA domain-containing protein [Niveibacterium sp. 24ML]